MPRRTNNRGRGKTNLDDLDSVLSGMIRPAENVKTVTNHAEERRFTMNSTDVSDLVRNLKEAPIDMSGCQATHTSDFEKHQVNYSDTKYIKP